MYRPAAARLSCLARLLLHWRPVDWSGRRCWCHRCLRLISARAERISHGAADPGVYRRLHWALKDLPGAAIKLPVVLVPPAPPPAGLSLGRLFSAVIFAACLGRLFPAVIFAACRGFRVAGLKYRRPPRERGAGRRWRLVAVR